MTAHDDAMPEDITDAEAFGDICGETYDHDITETYVSKDGRQWECRNCGAEGWEDPE